MGSAAAKRVNSSGARTLRSIAATHSMAASPGRLGPNGSDIGHIIDVRDSHSTPGSPFFRPPRYLIHALITSSRVGMRTGATDNER
jgi:hypothetical protein